LGSLLLQHCEAESRGAGAQRLILAVNKRNTRALAAYRRNGFAVVDSTVTEIGNGFVMDDFMMAKNLRDKLER
jgi:ribosomal protein S18 acetylase RimI-like enzyme